MSRAKRLNARPTSIRLTEEQLTEALFVVRVEAVIDPHFSMTDLIVEGLQLAIDRRREDPEFAATIHAFNEQASAFLQSPTTAPLE